MEPAQHFRQHQRVNRQIEFIDNRHAATRQSVRDDGIDADERSRAVALQRPGHVRVELAMPEPSDRSVGSRIHAHLLNAEVDPVEIGIECRKQVGSRTDEPNQCVVGRARLIVEEQECLLGDTLQ